MKKHLWLPSGYITLGRKGLIPFVLLTLAALYFLQFLEREYKLNSDFPVNHAVLEQLQEEKGRFTTEGDFVLLVFDSKDPFSAETFGALENLSRQLKELPEVYSVLSPLDLVDLNDTGTEWEFRPVVSLPLNDREDIREFRDRIEQTDIFRKLFLGNNDELGIYIFPENGITNEQFGETILNWSEDLPETVHLTGAPILKYHYSQMIIKDSRRLPVLALILIILIEYLVYRKVIVALVLCLASMVPMIWALALFPFLGLSMTMDNLIAPILVLGLASSYGIHLIRGRTVFPDVNLQGVLDRISGKVVIAGLTTMLGFTALLISPTVSFRKFGLIIILGICFALVFSLYALPAILRRTPVPTDHGQRFMMGLHRPAGKRINLIVVLLFLTLLGWGISRLYMDSRIISLLSSRHEYHVANTYFNSSFGGMNELELFCDSGEEYGIVSEDYYRRIKTAAVEIGGLDAVSSIISYTDFIDWMHSRVSGGGGRGGEPDRIFIGESLEMLSDNAIDGLELSSLIDPSWRHVRLLIRFRSAPGRKNWEEYGAMIRSISQIMEENGLGTVITGGPSVIQYHLINSHRNTILRGMALFFPMLILICLLLTRSPVWTFCIISSPVLGALIYFGMMGLIGIPLTVPPLLAVTCILGVSVDDNIFYTFALRKNLETMKFPEALKEAYRETAAPIMETSVCIVFVMLCLFPSGNRAMAQSGLLIILSQSLVTVYTLWFLPIFYPRHLKERKIEKKESPADDCSDPL